MASPRQQTDISGTELGFGGVVSRDPSTHRSCRNTNSGGIFSREALANDDGPVVGDSEVILPRMTEFIRDVLACIEFGIRGRLRKPAFFDQRFQARRGKFQQPAVIAEHRDAGTAYIGNLPCATVPCHHCTGTECLKSRLKWRRPGALFYDMLDRRITIWKNPNGSWFDEQPNVQIHVKVPCRY
jgi:hypothetical protein